jgi:cbb3-type cytochrome oxidase maturation protein
MDFVSVLVPVAVLMGGAFAVLFVLAVRQGQFDDLEDPPQRMLQEEEVPARKHP